MQHTSIIFYKPFLFVLLLLMVSFSALAQSEVEVWKAQLKFGVNLPNSKGFVNPFKAKSVNFPTVELGLQYMHTPKFGVKLDYGFNRIKNTSNAPEFKVNYSRVNLQFVFNPKTLMRMPKNLNFILHTGPGLSFIKPLNTYTSNKTTFFNALGGIEMHLYLARGLYFITDVSYSFSFAKDFKPESSGYGSFNGNLLTLTAGISISLGGCYYCD